MPRLTFADLHPPAITRRQREARAQRQAAELEAFAKALAAFSRRGFMQPKMREHIRRRGFPRDVVVTVVTPTGTECRKVHQGIGGWGL